MQLKKNRQGSRRLNAWETLAIDAAFFQALPWARY
jgi:hypothetical protein